MSGSTSRRVNAFTVICIALIIAGCVTHVLVTRQPGFGDEFVVVQNVWHMISERTIIPPHAVYPALYSYAITPAVVAASAIRVWMGAPPSYQDLSELMALRPLTGFWPARLVTMLCWMGCLWTVYVIGRGLWRERLPALAAAAVFAGAVGPLRYSGYALPDVPMMLVMTLALMFALRVVRGERPSRNIALAGLLGGLAVATKYQAVAVLAPVALAAWLAGGERLRLMGRAALAAAAGFIAGCPGWVLAPGHYWRGLMSVRAHMGAGHIGFHGVPLLGQLELLLRADAALGILGVLAALMLVKREHPDGGKESPRLDEDLRSSSESRALAVLGLAVAATLLVA
ncbi:MAG: glycosyltransferase family 39 protein, partial [Armatimonadetes bacterium]|nr:glycosyltransferase family 39 protein [Armatimonadota bacterium]